MDIIVPAVGYVPMLEDQKANATICLAELQ
jgi:hypothetical protein